MSHWSESATTKPKPAAIQRADLQRIAVSNSEITRKIVCAKRTPRLVSIGTRDGRRRKRMLCAATSAGETERDTERAQAARESRQRIPHGTEQSSEYKDGSSVPPSRKPRRRQLQSGENTDVEATQESESRIIKREIRLPTREKDVGHVHEAVMQHVREACKHKRP